MKPWITHVNPRNPTVGWDDNGKEYGTTPLEPGTYCGDCNKIFDAEDIRIGCCVECTWDAD